MTQAFLAIEQPAKAVGAWEIIVELERPRTPTEGVGQADGGGLWGKIKSAAKVAWKRELPGSAEPSIDASSTRALTRP